MAILVMAVGTGVAITMFAFVNGVLWSSLGLKESGEVLHIEWTESIGKFNDRAIEALDFEAFENEAESFAHLFGYHRDRGSLQNPSEDYGAEYAIIPRVSHNFFRAIGESPILGRSFLPEDVSRSQDDMIMLSHSAWMNHFGGDEKAIGSLINFKDRPYTVVGVMRPGFGFPENSSIWIASGWHNQRANGRTDIGKLDTLGILKADVSIESAQTELNTIARRLAQEYPETNETLEKVTIERFTQWYAGTAFANTCYGLFVCSLLVLGVACSNVFNLITARSFRRTSELSIRSALGAGRAQIVFQVVLDGLILSVLGAVGGVLLAGWSLKLIWAEMTQRVVPYWWHMEMDVKVLGFVVVIVLISALGASLLPGLRASRSATGENLKDDSRTSSGLFVGAVSRAVLGFQIAATGMLAVVSVMMLIAWTHLKYREMSFDPETVVAGYLTVTGLAKNQTNVDVVQFSNKLRERLETYPGVRATARTNGYYLHPVFLRKFEVEGDVYSESEQKPKARTVVMSDDFGKVFGIEPLIGRGFSELDTEDSQLVCMVNKRFAEYYWANEDPIGKRLKFSDWKRAGPDYRIVVGVLPDLLPKPLPGEDIMKGSYLKIYIPEEQTDETGMTLYVKANENAKQFMVAMRRELKALAPHLAFQSIRTIKEDEDRRIGDQTITFSMFGVFGAASLILGVVGLYAIMSFTVQQCSREYGIRMALGAGSKEIVRSVIAKAIWMLAIAGTLGVGFGHVASIKLRALIGLTGIPFGMTYPIVGGILLVATVISVGLPAWKASRLQPSKALRVD